MILLEDLVDNLYFKTLDLFDLDSSFDFFSQGFDYDILKSCLKNKSEYEYLRSCYRICQKDNVFLRLSMYKSFSFESFLSYKKENDLKLRYDKSYFLLNQIFPLVYSNMEYSRSCASFMDFFLEKTKKFNLL